MVARTIQGFGRQEGRKATECQDEVLARMFLANISSARIEWQLTYKCLTNQALSTSAHLNNTTSLMLLVAILDSRERQADRTLF